MSTPIEVTATNLEALAFESGREITISSDQATLTIGPRTFVARLPRIPAQRQPEQPVDHDQRWTECVRNSIILGAVTGA